MLIYWLKCLFVSDGKLIDGQVIQLEDGSAAYVQHVPIPKSSKYLMLLNLPAFHTSVFATSSSSYYLNLVLISSSPLKGKISRYHIELIKTILT